MATGVLIVGIERATKLLGHLSLDAKSYTATIRLGFATTTDDAAGDRTGGGSASAIGRGAWGPAVSALTGTFPQVPSSVSAVKIGGRRAHARIRDGEQVTIPPREVTVDRFDVVSERRCGDLLDLDVDVDCSSGTYVRALARDLGRSLGVGGHVTALRRTLVGPFDLSGARTLDAIVAEPSLSLSIDAAVRTAFELREVSGEQAVALSQGKWLEPVGMGGTYGVVDPSGRAIALVRERGRRASSAMVVRPATLAG